MGGKGGMNGSLSYSVGWTGWPCSEGEIRSEQNWKEIKESDNNYLEKDHLGIYHKVFTVPFDFHALWNALLITSIL